jgi:hypothetical protein
MRHANMVCAPEGQRLARAAYAPPEPPFDQTTNATRVAEVREVETYGHSTGHEDAKLKQPYKKTAGV